MSDQEVINKPAVISVFNDVEQAIAKFEEANEKLVFDLTTTKGMKEARSHIYTMRKAKGMAGTIKDEKKADLLAECKVIQDDYNKIIAKLDSMIVVQMAPIKVIEDAEAERLAKIAEEKRLEEEEAERLRLVEIEQQRVEAAEILAEANRIKEAIEEKAKEKADKLAREREKFEAEKKAEQDAKDREAKAKEEAEAKAVKDAADLAAKVEQDKKDAEAKAAKEKQDALDEQKRIADRKAKEIADKYQKEQADKDEAAKVEAARVADEEHRAKINNEIHKSLLDASFGDEVARQVTQALVDNEIKHVTINY